MTAVAALDAAGAKVSACLAEPDRLLRGETWPLAGRDPV